MTDIFEDFEKDLVRVGFSPRSAHNQRRLAMAFAKSGHEMTEEAAEMYCEAKHIGARATAEQVRSLCRFIKFADGNQITIRHTGKNGYSRPLHCWHNCIYNNVFGQCQYKPSVWLDKQITAKTCEYLTEPAPPPKPKHPHKLWDHMFGHEAVYIDSHSAVWR